MYDIYVYSIYMPHVKVFSSYSDILCIYTNDTLVSLVSNNLPILSIIMGNK